MNFRKRKGKASAANIECRSRKTRHSLYYEKLKNRYI